MRAIISASISILSLNILSCKNNKKKTAVKAVANESIEMVNKIAPPKKEKVILNSKNDSKFAQNVVSTTIKGPVIMTVLVFGLVERQHAIHVHEKEASSYLNGNSSKEQWNPSFAKYGIGSFNTDTNDHATKTFITAPWRIGCGDPKKDILGAALVAHHGKENLTSRSNEAAYKSVGCRGIIEL